MSEIPEWLSKEDKNRLQLAKKNMLNDDFGLSGWSVLHYAIFYHQNEIAEYLIKL